MASTLISALTIWTWTTAATAEITNCLPCYAASAAVSQINENQCTATVIASGFINPRTQTWITNGQPTKGYNMWLKFGYQLYFKFRCSAGQDSTYCGTCMHVDFNYLSSNNQWIQASGGTSGYWKDTSNCNQAYTAAYQVTYAYPYRPGTRMQMTLNVATLGPYPDTNCVGQEYDDVISDQWDIPANGP